MKKSDRILVAIHLVVSIGALGGGLAGLINPWSPAGMPLDLLEGSPFTNYFFPALILFTVIGLGHGLSALTLILKSRFSRILTLFFSLALIGFIIVQCLIISDVVALHLIFLALGLIGSGIALGQLKKTGWRLK